jgi:hypothetical protein
VVPDELDPLRLIPRLPCDRDDCDWQITRKITFRCEACELTDHKATRFLRSAAKIVLGR